MLVDPQKTTELGKPIGANSSLKTWQGDQWKIGGGATWGWYSYDPKLNLIYYGSGNPSTWNPKQRPGDNKWSMTIFARDADTGMAKWVYQMTPHDQWDYDGVNEMILADQQIGGQTVPTLVHFDRNGLGYTLNRATGELLVAAKYDPAVNWTTGVDMNKSSPTYGRPSVVAKYAPGEQRRGRQLARASARRRWAARTSSRRRTRRRPSCSTCRPTTSAWTMSRSACPIPRGSPMSARRCRCIPPAGQTNMGNFIAWDARTGKIVWSDPEQFSVWSGALATKGGVVFYGTLEGYLKAVDAKTGKELYKFKTPSGIIGNVMTYEHGGKQYVAVLSGVGGWAGIGLAAGLTDPTCRPRRGRRLCRAEQLHGTRRDADGVHAALELIGAALSRRPPAITAAGRPLALATRTSRCNVFWHACHRGCRAAWPCVSSGAHRRSPTDPAIPPR